MPVAYRKPVSISLPPPLRKAIDRLAKRQHQTTSELVRDALRRYIREVEADAAWRRAVAYGRKKAKALGVSTDQELEDAVTDIVNEYRHGARPASTATGRR
jgi:metal-responsive CopG/Arc/MetJ family transcriptional regulator